MDFSFFLHAYVLQIFVVLILSALILYVIPEVNAETFHRQLCCVGRSVLHHRL